MITTLPRFARRGIAAGLLAAGVLAGCSQPGNKPLNAGQDAGGIHFQLTTGTPPHSGDNTLVLRLTESATGNPVADATVTATADMTAPTTPGQEQSGRGRGDGNYEIPARLPVATGYRVHIHVLRQGQATDVVFPLDVAH